MACVFRLTNVENVRVLWSLYSNQEEHWWYRPVFKTLQNTMTKREHITLDVLYVHMIEKSFNVNVRAKSFSSIPNTLLIIFTDFTGKAPILRLPQLPDSSHENIVKQFVEIPCHGMYTTAKIKSIWKAQWKHSYLTFWYPGSGLAPTKTSILI